MGQPLNPHQTSGMVQVFSSSPTRGQLKGTWVYQMLGSAMGNGKGLYPLHDTQCESVLISPLSAKEEKWTECMCATRRALRIEGLHKVKIRKVNGMWRGWCHRCDKRVAKYYDCGAALGASLEHQRRVRT